MSYSYQKKDWRGPACQSFFWCDSDKDLKAHFVVTQLICEMGRRIMYLASRLLSIDLYSHYSWLSFQTSTNINHIDYPSSTKYQMMHWNFIHSQKFETAQSMNFIHSPDYKRCTVIIRQCQLIFITTLLFIYFKYPPLIVSQDGNFPQQLWDG